MFANNILDENKVMVNPNIMELQQAEDASPLPQQNVTVSTPYGNGIRMEIYNDKENGGEEKMKIKLDWGAIAYFNTNDPNVKVKKKLFEMSDEEKIGEGKKYKEEGNMFFKLDEFGIANAKYEIAKVYVRQVNNEPLLAEQIGLLLVPVLNNQALCLIKLDDFRRALELLDEALNYTKNAALNGKTYFIRSLAFKKMNVIEKAMIEINNAVKLLPSNVAVRNEYLALKQIWEQQVSKEKQLMEKEKKSKLAGSFQTMEEQVEEKSKNKKKSVNFSTPQPPSSPPPPPPPSFDNTNTIILVTVVSIIVLGVSFLIARR